MSMLFAALVSFLSIALLVTHVDAKWMRRIAGHAGTADLILHITVFYMFFGTSTLGFLQAEASAILFSIALRTYRSLLGYERLTIKGWVRYAGRMTKVVKRIAE
jgi:hypothetical protein